MHISWRMILVTGPTGKNGWELLRLLSSRGIPARAMLHRPNKDEVMPNGVDVAPGDFTRPESLDLALKGVDHAFLVTPPDEHAFEWQANFIAAAKRAGVQHIVKLSILGAADATDSRFHASHRAAEKALEESGIGWTHLRPNFYMQTATQYLQGDRFYVIAGDSRISAVDVRDVAAVAATALVEPGHEGQAYDITGPAPLTNEEMAAELAAALKQDIPVVPLTFAQARSTMSSLGFKDWNIEGIIELNRWFQSGAAAVVSDVVQRVGKQEPRRFAEFAQDWARSQVQ